jgi:hypothetical protein
MDNSKDTRISGIWVIVGIIIIYILFMLWVTERNKNKEAEAVFATQTLQASRDEYVLSYLATQKAKAFSASQEIEADTQDRKDDIWFWDCILINDAPIYEESYTCIIGQIMAVEKDNTSSNPTMYFTRFSNMPNGFFVYGTGYFKDCVGCCVAVRGRIHITDEGAPFIGIADFGKSDFITPEVLGISLFGYIPDDVQFVPQELCQLSPESADGTPHRQRHPKVIT